MNEFSDYHTSFLLKLETDQQEKCLPIIKELLITDEINKRADASEKAIDGGHTKSFEQFNEDFEQWEVRKRAIFEIVNNPA